MRMSDDSYYKLNVLLGKLFNANAVVDNLVYNLEFHYLKKIADKVHEGVAHAMPRLADEVADKMIELSARPTRKDIGGYEEEYDNVIEIFKVLYETIIDLGDFTKGLIVTADMNDDDEVRIYAEAFLDTISKYIKQGEEWLYAANVLSPNDLNIHIDEYTHYL